MELEVSAVMGFSISSSASNTVPEQEKMRQAREYSSSVTSVPRQIAVTPCPTCRGVLGITRMILAPGSALAILAIVTPAAMDRTSLFCAWTEKDCIT